MYVRSTSTRPRPNSSKSGLGRSLKAVRILHPTPGLAEPIVAFRPSAAANVVRFARASGHITVMAAYSDSCSVLRTDCAPKHEEPLYVLMANVGRSRDTWSV